MTIQQIALKELKDKFQENKIFAMKKHVCEIANIKQNGEETIKVSKVRTADAVKVIEGYIKFIEEDTFEKWLARDNRMP